MFLQALSADGPESLARNVVRNDLGVLLRTLGRPAEAEPLLRESLSFYERTNDTNDPWLSHPLNTLATVLVMQNKLGEARTQLARAWRLKASAHDNISCRVVWTRLVAAILANEPLRPCVGLLKSLLGLSTLPAMPGVGAARWDITPVIDFLRPQLASVDADLLAVLVEALNDPTRLSDLEVFLAWRDQSPLPLDTAWPPDPEEERSDNARS